MKSGEQIETAIVGTEGVGGWVALDGANANTQSTVQIEGSGWELPTAKFLEVYKTSYALRSAINKYQAIILFQAQQSAACHALHSVESRLCRWLFAGHDRFRPNRTDTGVPVPHARGSSSVSLCAHTLRA
jgi:CRP-like cAMP-binding protein